MTYLSDTSCLVALLCSWHEHHEATWKEMNQRKQSGETVILAAHSLIETYAVLTRLPYPYRLTEQDAWQLLDGNFSKSRIVTLTAAQHWGVLKLCSDRNISGGQIYDSVIAACARKGKAKVLLTWNREHFIPFQDKELLVERPG